jgi:hypothetical protein
MMPVTRRDFRDVVMESVDNIGALDVNDGVVHTSIVGLRSLTHSLRFVRLMAV